MDSDTYFRMATIGRSIESWLAGLPDVHFDPWTTDPEPKPDGLHDPFFAIGLDGNPVTGYGSDPRLCLLVSLDSSSASGYASARL